MLRLELPELLAQPGTLLYIGANPEMHTALEMLHQAGHRITVLEIWPDYVQALRQPPLSAWVDEVVTGDARYVDRLLGGRQFDVVFWFHGPEHIRREEFEPLMTRLEARAERLVVLGAPWGNTLGQGPKPYDHHISFYYARDWEALGYEVRTIPPMDAHMGHMLGWKWQQGRPRETIVVYTANIDGYDTMWPAPDDVECVCFADKPVDAPGWDVRQVERVFDHPKADALWFKYQPHLYFPESSCTIWVDANIGFRTHPADLPFFGRKVGIAVRPHLARDCIYEEAQAVVIARYAPPEIVEAQTRAMEDASYPRHNGLSETGVLIRFNRPEVSRFNEAVWEDICRWGSWRDQLSFDFVLWRLEIRVELIPGGPLINAEHPLFKYWRHNREHGSGS